MNEYELGAAIGQWLAELLVPWGVLLIIPLLVTWKVLDVVRSRRARRRPVINHMYARRAALLQRRCQ